MIREIVKIDETLCDGCGKCIPNCQEGALQIIEGKARLISELMCDGLGACLGHCPQNAITIEKREAAEYNERIVIEQMVKSGKTVVFAHLKHLKDHNENTYLNEALSYIKQNQESMPFSLNELHDHLHNKKQPVSPGCPGSRTVVFPLREIKTDNPENKIPSALTHWPVQLHLINPSASSYHEAELLISADCAAYAHGNFHQKFLKGKKLVIACPKLDSGMDIYIHKLTSLIDDAKINSITAVIMEVPCCGGILGLVNKALENSVRKLPVNVIIISLDGTIKQEFSF